MSFIGVQFNSAVVGLIAYFYFSDLNIPLSLKAALLYVIGALTSVTLVKFNKIGLAFFFGGINICVLLIPTGLLLGRTSSIWVYFIGSALGSHFFLNYSKRIQRVSDITIFGGFLVYLILDLMQIVPSEITEQNRLAMHRLGSFNILYALAVVVGLVGYFYRQSESYRLKLESQAEALREQLNLVSTILNNMKQAIFAINSEKMVVAPVSEFTSTIFPSKLEGCTINEVLFNEAVGSELCSRVNSTLELAFGEDELNWQMLKPNLPEELDVRVNDQFRKLKISYSDLRDEKELLEKVLLVVEDVTEMKELREKIRVAGESRDREMQIVQQVYLKEPEELSVFFKNTERLINEIPQSFGKTQVGQAEIKGLSRNLHTIKGNARAHGFSLLSSRIHSLENEVHELLNRESETAQEKASILDRIRNDVSEQVNEYLSVSRKLVDLGTDSKGFTKKSEGIVTFEKKNWNRFVSKMNEYIEDRIPLTAEFLNYELAKIAETPLFELLREKQKMVGEISESLGKQVNYTVSGDYVTVPEATANVIYDVLTHALRNSIDHGIEIPQDRIIHEKKSVGSIEARVEQVNGEVILTLTDDGRGIDPEKVAERAVTTGLITAEKTQTMSASEKLELVFLSGLSTLNAANEYSGRGVGMETLKVAIESLGGRVAIQSVIGSGTTLKFYIPVSPIPSTGSSRWAA